MKHLILTHPRLLFPLILMSCLPAALKPAAGDESKPEAATPVVAITSGALDPTLLSCSAQPLALAADADEKKALDVKVKSRESDPLADPKRAVRLDEALNAQIQEAEKRVKEAEAQLATAEAEFEKAGAEGLPDKVVSKMEDALRQLKDRVALQMEMVKSLFDQRNALMMSMPEGMMKMPEGALKFNEGDFNVFKDMKGPVVSFSENLDLGDTGKRAISLKRENVDAMDAVTDLLKQAKASYVLGGEPPKGRKVTFDFHNVPLNDALGSIGDAAGLRYSLRGQVIVLSPSGSFGGTVLYTPLPPGPFPKGAPEDLFSQRKYKLLKPTTPMPPRAAPEAPELPEVKEAPEAPEPPEAEEAPEAPEPPEAPDAPATPKAETKP